MNNDFFFLHVLVRLQDVVQDVVVIAERTTATGNDILQDASLWPACCAYRSCCVLARLTTCVNHVRGLLLNPGAGQLYIDVNCT